MTNRNEKGSSTSPIPPSPVILFWHPGRTQNTSTEKELQANLAQLREAAHGCTHQLFLITILVPSCPLLFKTTKSRKPGNCSHFSPENVGVTKLYCVSVVNNENSFQIPEFKSYESMGPKLWKHWESYWYKWNRKQNKKPRETVFSLIPFILFL